MAYASIPGWCARCRYDLPDWYYRDGCYVGPCFSARFAGVYSVRAYRAYHDYGSRNDWRDGGRYFHENIVRNPRGTDGGSPSHATAAKKYRHPKTKHGTAPPTKRGGHRKTSHGGSAAAAKHGKHPKASHAAKPSAKHGGSPPAARHRNPRSRSSSYSKPQSHRRQPKQGSRHAKPSAHAQSRSQHAAHGQARHKPGQARHK